MAKADKNKVHQMILKEATAMTDRYLEIKNKSKVAEEFGVSISGVDVALFHTGHKDLCAKSSLERMRSGAPVTVRQLKEEPAIPSSVEGLQAKAVAAELLTKAVEAIGQYNTVASDVRYWKGQADELEAKLRKEREEKDRILRVHNEMVKQSNGGRLPSIEEVVNVLRREHTQGKPL